MSGMLRQVQRQRSRSRSRNRCRETDNILSRERERRSKVVDTSSEESDVSEYEETQSVLFEEFSKFATKIPKKTVNFTGEATTDGEKELKPLTYWQMMKHVYRTIIDNTFANSNLVVDPEGQRIYWWMTFVTATVLYNVWMIIFRITFKEMRENETNRKAFGWIDFVCDIVFFLDFLINFRVAYIKEGLLVKDPLQLANYYRKRMEFKLDFLSIVPLGTIALLCGEFGAKDIFYIHFDLENDHILIPVLRLPRLLKLHSMETYFVISDTRTSNPNRQRAFKLTMYLGGIIHWIACFYYMLSEYEGFGINEWVYPDEGINASLVRKYIRIMYWSTVTLTTIGGEGNPVTNSEYVFTGVTFLIGVFLFAAVVGNVGDVISNMNAARQEFIAKMDAIKVYMNHRKVPEALQSRVKKWSDYAWKRTQALDDQTFLEILPPRLKQDLAIHVHLESLKKVKIFENCEQGLLCELVLKLRSQIFSPSDFICKKGEIGREMYIINHGKVSVVIEDPVSGQRITVATLSAGSYFGEISLLKLEGGQNRRTADVVAEGYAELLCLSRKDLMQSMIEYPEAKKVMEQHGRDRMAQNKEASRLQRRKSEANLSVPGGGDEKDEGENEAGSTKSPAVKKAETVVKTVTGMLKSREMSELRHVINELKGFDSLATKSRIQELSEKCDDLKTKLHKRDAYLKRALQQISELESRVAGKPHKNGKLPHHPNNRRRLNLNINGRSISLTGVESSNDDDSSTSWKIEGLDTCSEPAERRRGSSRTSSPTRPRTPSTDLNSEHANIKANTPSTPTPRSVLTYPHQMVVPGISINDEVLQEQHMYTWMTPPIGSSRDEVLGSSQSESESADVLNSSTGAKMLSCGSSKSPAPSLSGDLSDLSDYSIDSDF